MQNSIKHQTWIVVFFLLSSIFLSRVYKGTVTLYDYGDDDQYWAFSHSLIYQGNLDLAHDSLTLFQLQPDKLDWMSPFPGLLWSPAVLLGKILSPVISHFPGVSPEQAAGGSSAPQRLLVSAFSACLTLGGLLLLYECLTAFFAAESAFAATVLIFLSTPLPYYTFRRPLMAHSAEFFTLALFALWCLRFCLRPSRTLAFWSGITAALAVGVRYPNACIVGAWIIMLAWVYRPQAVFQRWNWVCAFLGVILPTLVQIVIWKKILGTWTNHMGAYSFEPSHLLSLLAVNRGSLRAIADIFLGPGWGLVWMETPMLISLWLTIRGRSPDTARLRILFLAGVIPLLLIAANNPFGVGASYGYRYLLAKVLWMAFGLSLYYDVFGRSRPAKWIPFILCLFPLFAYFLFESGPESLTLHKEEGWGNAHYAANVLAALVHDPKQLAFALTGCPAMHILLWGLSKTIGLGFLPSAIGQKVSGRLDAVSVPELFWFLGWVWFFSLGLLGLLFKCGRFESASALEKG